jgi:hypothetical protein
LIDFRGYNEALFVVLRGHEGALFVGFRRSSPPKRAGEPTRLPLHRVPVMWKRYLFVTNIMKGSRGYEGAFFVGHEGCGDASFVSSGVH